MCASHIATRYAIIAASPTPNARRLVEAVHKRPLRFEQPFGREVMARGASQRNKDAESNEPEGVRAQSLGASWEMAQHGQRMRSWVMHSFTSVRRCVGRPLSKAMNATRHNGLRLSRDVAGLTAPSASTSTSPATAAAISAAYMLVSTARAAILSM